VGIINALNIIDGVNGLAAGVAIIGFSAMAIVGHQIHSVRVVMLCLILAAATLGFLLHNLRPSRVFLGDTGSLFLGALLGIVSLHLMNLSQATFNLPVFALIIGLPVLDVFVAMVRRYFKARDRKRPLLHRLHATVIPDNNHIHHRLITRGYSHLQTSLLLYAFSLMLCVGAFTMQFVDTALKLALAAYLLLAVGIVLYRLGFGARFFKYLRRWRARLAPRVRAPDFTIGVIDTRGVIYHACREAALSGMVFERVNLMNTPGFGSGLAALVVFNPPQTPLSQDFTLARAFYRETGRPVFIVTEKIRSDIRLSGPEVIYGKKMPVNIQPFLQEIRDAIRDNGSAPAARSVASSQPGRAPVETTEIPHEIAS
jgi:UDP-GlcNAc:undecaprenyl-phosphate GlcNAc-1-phosphate transferase